MNKRLLAALLAAGILGSLAGCGNAGSAGNGAAGSGSETGASYDLRIISEGMNNSWMQAVQSAAMQAGEDINQEAGYQKVTLSYVGPESQSDVAVQVQQLSEAVSAGADCIGLAALDVDAVSELCDTAAENGIPIVTWCSDITDKEAVKAFVETGSYAAGGEAADRMYEMVSDRMDGNPVRIGVLSWTASAEDTVERGLGFLDVFAERCSEDGKTVAVTGNERFTAEVMGDFVSEDKADVILEVRVPSQTTAELASTEAGALLSESDLVGIFANTQDAAEGVLTANQNLNVLGCEENNVIFIGFDAGEVQEEAVRSGVEYGAVNQSPSDIGCRLVETMLEVAEGEEPTDVKTAYVFLRADNLDSEEVQAELY